MSSRKLIYSENGEKKLKIIPKELSFKEIDFTKHNFFNKVAIDLYFELIGKNDYGEIIRDNVGENMILHDNLMMIGATFLKVQDDKQFYQKILQKIIIGCLQCFKITDFVTMESFGNAEIMKIYFEMIPPYFWDRIYVYENVKKNLIVTYSVYNCARIHNFMRLIINHNWGSFDILNTAVILTKSIILDIDMFIELYETHLLSPDKILERIEKIKKLPYFDKKILKEPSMKDRMHGQNCSDFVNHKYDEIPNEADNLCDFPRTLYWFYHMFGDIYKNAVPMVSFDINKEVVDKIKKIENKFIRNAVLEWLSISSVTFDENLTKLLMSTFEIKYSKYAILQAIRIFIRQKTFDYLPKILKNSDIKIRYLEGSLLLDNYSIIPKKIMNKILSDNFDTYLQNKHKFLQKSLSRLDFSDYLNNNFGDLIDDIIEQKSWVEITFWHQNKLIKDTIWNRYIKRLLYSMSKHASSEILFIGDYFCYSPTVVDYWFLVMNLFNHKLYCKFYFNLYLSQLHKFLPTNKKMREEAHIVSEAFWIYINKLVEIDPTVIGLLNLIIRDYGSNYQYVEFVKRYPEATKFDMFIWPSEIV